MGLRINTNVAALSAERALSRSSRDLEKSMKSLASGERITGNDFSAADFAISEHLKGQIRGMRAATQNADNAQSFVQVAEGGLNEQNNILLRQRELAIQSASDTFSDTEREMMQVESDQLKEEFDRIAKTTQFGSQKLLSGDEKEYEFQVGAYKGDDNIIKYNSNTNTTASEMGVDGISVSDKSDARDALETIDEAMTKIAQARANFGATQSRLESVVNNGNTQVENLTAARSKMADTDVAKAVGDVARAQVLQQYQLATLAQANQFPGQVLKLIA